MLNNTANISKLKSVSITAINAKKRLLISSKSLLDFQTLLEDHIRDEVFIVSTNIGMQVFYISELDYSTLIKEEILLCVSDNEKVDLSFKSYLDGIVVFESFSAAMHVFAKYPQVFLAYSKKFLFLLKQNKRHAQLTGILSFFYHIALEHLKTAGSVPHLQRIEALYDARKLKNSQVLDVFLQGQLAKGLLDKVHNN